MDMEALIASVGVSVQRAQAQVQEAALEQYLSYFELPCAANGGEAPAALSPKTLALALPGRETPLEVPLLALASHNNLRLEQVKVKLHVAPTLEEGAHGALDLTAAPPSQDGHTVELVFQCGEPSEGVARINESIHTTL